jgi:N-methylhydantoinase B
LIINGKRVDPKSQHVVDPGGTVLMRTPAGGGFGRPDKRAPERIAADRSDGYIAG